MDKHGYTVQDKSKTLITEEPSEQTHNSALPRRGAGCSLAKQNSIEK